MSSFEIEITKDWLTSAYYVYVVTIVYEKKTYLYIGQTGDNHYHSARAPLYRIGGHFAKGVSTENQIIKYFKNTVLEKDNISNHELEQKLIKSKLNYKFWEICAFDGNDLKDVHKDKRMRAQAVEHYLIFKLLQKEDVIVLNSKVNAEISKSKRDYFKDDIGFISEKGNEILKELGNEG